MRFLVKLAKVFVTICCQVRYEEFVIHFDLIFKVRYEGKLCSLGLFFEKHRHEEPQVTNREQPNERFVTDFENPASTDPHSVRVIFRRFALPPHTPPHPSTPPNSNPTRPKKHTFFYPHPHPHT
jgi:hypothetical protein